MTPEADLMEQMQERPTLHQKAELIKWKGAYISGTDNHLVCVTSPSFSCLGVINTGEGCKYGDNGILQITLNAEQRDGLCSLGLREEESSDSEYYCWVVSVTPVKAGVCVRISPRVLPSCTRDELRAKKEVTEHDLALETMAIATTMELQQAFSHLRIEPVNHRESMQKKTDQKKGT